MQRMKRSETERAEREAFAYLDDVSGDVADFPGKVAPNGWLRTAAIASVRRVCKWTTADGVTHEAGTARATAVLDAWREARGHADAEAIR